MGFKCGIVGLPNVGKSTLFNALTNNNVQAQNFPFCTIEPNSGKVAVSDKRLDKLTDLVKPEKVIPTTMDFIDIAGLVKGASTGEGLGNKFLANIREVDAIAHVARSFKDKNITHVHDRVDPKDDAAIINLELVLADWQTVSKRLEKTKKQTKGAKVKEVELEVAVLEKLNKHLDAGNMARTLEYTEEEQKIVRDLHLLTMKPMMYVINIDEPGGKEEGEATIVEEGVPHIYVCGRLEAELVSLSDEEAKEYLQELGVLETGLDKMIVAGYKLLDLVTYFTSGEQETRAWTVEKNTFAPDAAGVIHTDFIKGFIKADVANCEKFVENGGWNGVREKGQMQLVGKDYIVKDGDVMYFHVST